MHRKGNITASCPICGTSFRTYTKRYCSPACYYASRVRPLAERFWAKVQKTETCWLFQGGTTEGGYGVIGKEGGGGNILTHRASWEIHFGPIPDGLWVLHHCDNPPCVRPDHLFLGTPLINSADMVEKGRAPKPWAQVTDAQAADIRERAIRRGDQAALAREYGVSAKTICDIVNGRTYRH